MRHYAIEGYAQWRLIARGLIHTQVPPHEVDLHDCGGETRLFPDDDSQELLLELDTKPTFTVPRAFFALSETVGYHRSPDRWNWLYRVLYRLVGGERHLLELTTDDDVQRLMQMEKSVRRDAHKMKAFVRFRQVKTEGGAEHFVAWYEPDHRIVRKVAPFFAERFREMTWSILTPDESVYWDQNSLQFGEGVRRESAPAGDELEQAWKVYYANIFNPARIKLAMMKSEMPVRFWKNLPEAEIIGDLLADAPRRVAEMIRHQEGYAKTALDYFPPAESPPSLERLAEYARNCRACDLCIHATQTVFGEGDSRARLVLLGEQPGDIEDQLGRPFVGPAGQVLDDALKEAGLRRENLYATNVVKHFKYEVEPRGKRRLHRRPDAREIRACRPWFEAELALIQPAVLVCLGATAATAVMGPNFKLTNQRGRWLASPFCHRTLATWHPSAILRTPDDDSRKQRFRELVADLSAANAAVE